MKMSKENGTHRRRSWCAIFICDRRKDVTVFGDREKPNGADPNWADGQGRLLDDGNMAHGCKVSSDRCSANWIPLYYTLGRIGPEHRGSGQSNASPNRSSRKWVLFAFALSAPGIREAAGGMFIDLKKFMNRAADQFNLQLFGRIFHGENIRLRPNMELSALPCCFVMPAAFACYKTDGDLKISWVMIPRTFPSLMHRYRAIRKWMHHSAQNDGTADIGIPQDLPAFFKDCAKSLGWLASPWTMP